MSGCGSLEVKYFFETHYWATMIPELQQIQNPISPEMFLSVPISWCIGKWSTDVLRLATEPGNNNWCFAIPSPWCLKWYPSYQERCYWINIRLGRDYLKCKICSFSAAIWIGRYDTAQNCVRRTFGLQYWPRPMAGHGQVARNSDFMGYGHPTMRDSKHHWYIHPQRFKNHRMRPLGPWKMNSHPSDHGNSLSD